MILTWNLDQYLNMANETWQRQKKIDDNVISTNCEVIVYFSVYGQFGAIWKPDSGHMV